MIISLLAIALASIPVRYAPASPTVGDRVTIEVKEEGITFDRASEVEFIDVQGSTATVRVMRPGARKLSFQGASARTYAIDIPVRSVLAENDALKPAPLQAPLPVPYPRKAKIALAASGAAAVVSWAALWMLYRRDAGRVPAIAQKPLIPARDEFLLALDPLASRHDRAAAIALADATRRYLSRVDPSSSLELTTSELLQRLATRAPVVSRILRAGDRAKFAPWPSQADPSLVTEARSLIDLFEPVEVAS